MARKRTERRELRAYLRMVPSRNVYEQKKQRRRARLTRLDDWDEPIKPAEQTTIKPPREPQVWLASWRKPLPPFLKLPAELRQKVLEMVLDDDSVLYPRPNQTTVNMALTCKIIAEDMRPVMKLWNMREMQVRGGFPFDRSVVDDLLRPLKVASAVFTSQQRQSRGRHIVFADAAGASKEEHGREVGPPSAQQSKQGGKDARPSESSCKREMHSMKRTTDGGTLEPERQLENEAASTASEAQRQRQDEKIRKRRKQKARKRKERLANRGQELLELKDRDRKQYRNWARKNVMEAAIVKERNILRAAYGLGTTTYLSDAED
ncbi:uncharacterized protein MYCFIDRAFT_214133 [Pseudocercospora fijiensis CIRAD86]|uniref:Uncharacterized protein n=1 Tax=Pseudocercospora fijiensis (strain CIRAD86) TaxID=383855 RepID=M3ANH8_PSEFD|nr:uncharacterized protein MYCFIDRAFT_214133 [Pseudocercospora fijiensis CIRAD86]EME86151.1 hypothetical protein MYCFIDRAFT_214133 [Pseudocercospora fijiensis CIRAD86]